MQIEQETDTSDKASIPITVTVQVHIQVEGRLVKRGTKKGSKINHRSISILAILSDGTFVSYYKTK